MSVTIASWYAFGEEGSTVLRCAACQNAVDLEVLGVDHHPRICPRCKVECAFLNWKGRVLQIVPANAPSVIQRALVFAQQEFDELEYAEFVSALQELMDDLYSAVLTGRLA
jgi:phage FluMu protein Com